MMMDLLIKKIKTTENPTVVGLDPTLEIIPQYIKKEMFDGLGKTPNAVGAMFTKFNKAIIDAICDLVPAVKLQIAMYEGYGIAGIKSYIQTAEYAKQKDLIVIGDIKRGDISSTAEAYASHIGGVTIEGVNHDSWKVDAITVNPYFGTDGILPFIKNCKTYNKGIFILIRTSNKSSYELQELKIAGSGRPLYHHVADLVGEWGKDLIGQHGYSLIGAVVGATHKDQGISLRRQLPHTFFLVPGYGAQGGTGADLRGYFDKNGLGITVNSSRGIIGAWKKEENAENSDIPIDFAASSREAAIRMKKDLQLAMEG